MKVEFKIIGEVRDINSTKNSLYRYEEGDKEFFFNIKNIKS